MPRFRVREGERLGANGVVHEAGAVVELPRSVADDPAVRGCVDEIDASGQVVAAAPADDLERFRAHERVSILRDRLKDATSRVEDLTRQLAAEEQTLADAVKAASAQNKPSAKKTETPAPAPVKE